MKYIFLDGRWLEGHMEGGCLYVRAICAGCMREFTASMSSLEGPSNTIIARGPAGGEKIKCPYCWSETICLVKGPEPPEPDLAKFSDER